MPIPPWFGRCVGRYLSHVLLEKNGVSDLLVYMFDGEDEGKLYARVCSRG
jgi:hypothetical protein